MHNINTSAFFVNSPAGRNIELPPAAGRMWTAFMPKEWQYARLTSVHQTLPVVMGEGDIWWLSPISVSLKDPGRGTVCKGSKPV